jgi:hypothetical protein
MKIRAFVFLLGVGVSLGQGLTAAAEDAEPAGIVLAVQGTVTMQPATMTPPMPLRQFGEIGPLSILESQSGSRCKVLFADDSLLTLGDNSRLEVTEQSYTRGSDQRAFVAHLWRGSVRALVTRQFESDNSIFQIDAGTSAVRARGTYFVTWVNGKPPAGKRPADEEGMEMEGATGVANIGRTGNVAFTSGGATVLVLPGQFSIALPGGQPSMPTSIQTHIVPVASAISATVLPDTPKKESPREALAAAGIGEASTGGAVTAAPVVAKAGTLGGNAPSTAYVLPDWPLPITPVTPPAVVSGAAFGGTSTVNLTIRLP